MRTTDIYREVEAARASGDTQRIHKAIEARAALVRRFKTDAKAEAPKQELVDEAQMLNMGHLKK